MAAPRRALARPLSVLLLAALLLLAACDRKEAAQGAMTEDKQAASAKSAAPAAPAPSSLAAPAPRVRTVVEVQKLEPRDFTLSSTYIGFLLPQERIELRSELEGVAERVQFDEGDAVSRGQLLTNINTEQLTVRRDQARSELELADSNYARDVNLHARKLVTDSQLEQSRTKRDLTRYALKLAEIELQKSSVTSPIDGRIKTRGVDRGEFLNKGQLIAEILDVSRVRALFDVPERDVRYLQVGRKVDVTFEALPGEVDPGVVRLVGLEADTKTRTFPVEVQLQNAKGRLRPGMLARVRVPLEQFRAQLMIPRYALLEREQGQVVFVAQEGRAVERSIVTGSSSEGQVQVLKGLDAGDLLIVTGQQKLTPGEPVDVRQAAH